MARKVLIADDSPTVQKKASGILTGEGMEVITVSNGVAAIKKLPTVNPLVILADVAMPGKDGYEVCEFVKASKEYVNVPVVLVFSDNDMYDEQKGARAHADGRIKKPFDRDELIATVTKFLAAAEAAAAKALAAPPVKVAPPPPRTYVTEPVDEEPEIATRNSAPDFSAFSGVAISEAGMEEISATPPEPVPSYESPALSEPTPVIEAEAPPVEAPIIEPEVPVAVEPPMESAAEMPLPPPAEPVFVEEQAAPAHSHEHEHELEPVTERTIMFRAPAEIAQPVLSDELTPEPSVVEPPRSEAPPVESVSEMAPPEAPQMVAPAETAPEPEPESAPVAATTLESYSLSEAAAGHVRVAYQEPQTEQAAPPAAEAPAVAAAEVPRALDSAQVYSIVYMVVAKMSPRLPPQSIEEITKPLADEINAELNASNPNNS